jgi:GDP-4-dehydro-6-deoxy-D-mannose reductase
MRVLITGAGGFLGGALARRLAGRRGVQVAALARRPAPALPGALVADLACAEAVDAAVAAARPDIVVHAAGRTYGAPEALQRDNVVATGNLISALARLPGETALLLLGSAGQYGASADRRPWREDDACAPAGPYGAAKQAAEDLAFAAALRGGPRVTALRLFNVVPPSPQGEQAFDSFLRRAAAALAGPAPYAVRMGPLGAVRDFVAAEDVLAAIERVIERRVWGERFNVCTGVGRTVRALLAATAARLPTPLVIDEDDGPGGLDWSVGDPSRCEARLGLRLSSDLDATLQSAADWIVAKEAADARS